MTTYSFLVEKEGARVLIVNEQMARGQSMSKSATYSHSIANHKTDSTKIVGWGLFGFGAAALVISIIYTSSLLAFIGLGLVFWGLIIKYITNEIYTKKPLLDSSVMSYSAILDEILAELNYSGKAVYLPPKYLKKLESNIVYIPKNTNAKLPVPEQVLHEDKIFAANQEFALLKPPGDELARLFSRALHVSFEKVDLKYFERNVPRLLIDVMETAENVNIKINGSLVNVTLENSVFSDMCKENKNRTNIASS